MNGWDGEERRHGRPRPMSIQTIIAGITLATILTGQAVMIVWYFRGQQAEIEALEQSGQLLAPKSAFDALERTVDWHQQQITKVLTILDGLDSLVLRVSSAETAITDTEQKMQVLYDIRVALAETVVKLQNLSDDVQEIKAQIVPDSAARQGSGRR